MSGSIRCEVIEVAAGDAAAGVDGEVHRDALRHGRGLDLYTLVERIVGIEPVVAAGIGYTRNTS